MYTKLKSVNVQQTNDIIQMQSLSTSKLVIILQVTTVAAATTTLTARYGGMVLHTMQIIWVMWIFLVFALSLPNRLHIGNLKNLARYEKLLLYAYIEFQLKQYIRYGLDYIKQVLWKQQIEIYID